MEDVPNPTGNGRVFFVFRCSAAQRLSFSIPGIKQGNAGRVFPRKSIARDNVLLASYGAAPQIIQNCVFKPAFGAVMLNLSADPE
jgi:hypothetical protein